ncbi:MAG: PilX N-terminal domain-containing pilus assembly protein [Pseudomonadales bacterium]
MIERKTQSYRRSQGVILIVSLVLLLAMTLIGIAAIDTTNQDSKMARNTLCARNVYQISLSEVQAQHARLNSDDGLVLGSINNSTNSFSNLDSIGITVAGPGTYLPDSSTETGDPADPYNQEVYIVFSGNQPPPSGYSLGIYIGKGYEVNSMASITNTSCNSNQTQGMKRAAPAV